ncbi:hypothetical protein L1281_000261 [Neisseria sp. HSC-16F19]|nr:hypothetical protein [Neisseria sp. HSC-16F19]MCP2039691.1 hypothetical protein [Neisseria sp. HSC-16F19]
MNIFDFRLLCLAVFAAPVWVQAQEAGSEPAIERMDTPAPWVQTVSAARIPPLYQQQWRRAENRAHCALVALPNDSKAQQRGAKARAAVFHGGWAVAYDLPGKRSAYGVAGAGIEVDDASIQRWMGQRYWADGSAVGYGLHGSGSGYLAYVRVAGEDCLYNVWSNISLAHLQQILADLRRVRRYSHLK